MAVTGLAIAGLALVACGGGATADTPTATATQAAVATATATVAPAATNTPVAPTATIAPAPTQPPSNGNDDLVAQGRVLFEETAGGTGCSLCHGLDARGMAGVGSPDIRGKSAADIWAALDTRAQMSFLVLTDDEVTTIAAYLAYLAEQE